jgi:phosphoglycolate phosphatase
VDARTRRQPDSFFRRVAGIFTDLDGTLTNPEQEMLSAAAYALGHFGMENTDPEKLRLFLKVPLLHCFEEDFGLTHDQANKAFQHYWYYAGTFGVQKNIPYDGIPELLAELKKRGKRIAIATARKTNNARQIVKANKLDGYFERIMGASEEDDRQTKKMIIFDLLCEMAPYEDSQVVMIGDRVVDIQGAHDNGISSIAVTFGQEPREDLIKAKPTYVANSVQEMTNILLGQNGQTAGV